MAAADNQRGHPYDQHAGDEVHLFAPRSVESDANDHEDESKGDNRYKSFHGDN